MTVVWRYTGGTASCTFNLDLREYVLYFFRRPCTLFHFNVLIATVAVIRIFPFKFNLLIHR